MAQNDVAADARWFRWLEGIDPPTGRVRQQPKQGAAGSRRGTSQGHEAGLLPSLRRVSVFFCGAREMS
jgi:hypothetical protein